MASDEQNYKARNFNIAGLAMMSPLGKFVLEPFEMFSRIGPIKSIFYIVICIILFIVGFILIDKGRDILVYYQ